MKIGGHLLQKSAGRPQKMLAGGLDVKPQKDGHCCGEAMKICFSAISCFYDYLVDEDTPLATLFQQFASNLYLIKGYKNIKRLLFAMGICN